MSGSSAFFFARPVLPKKILAYIDTTDFSGVKPKLTKKVDDIKTKKFFIILASCQFWVGLVYEVLVFSWAPFRLRF